MLQSTSNTAVALEPYLIRSNGRETFSVQPVGRGVPKWQRLPCIPSGYVNKTSNTVSDVVYILLQVTRPLTSPPPLYYPRRRAT
jgi:hypothetical protein